MTATTAVPAAAARRTAAPGLPPGRPAQRVESKVRTTGLKKLAPQALEGERAAQRTPGRRARRGEKMKQTLDRQCLFRAAKISNPR